MTPCSCPGQCDSHPYNVFAGGTVTTDCDNCMGGGKVRRPPYERVEWDDCPKCGGRGMITKPITRLDRL